MSIKFLPYTGPESVVPDDAQLAPSAERVYDETINIPEATMLRAMTRPNWDNPIMAPAYTEAEQLPAPQALGQNASPFKLGGK